ncbi:nitrilase-related carbon-nitrogen hydrolase [Mucilaginibacter sp.]|uniref:nitrilase-related carbon-nitrogen hydrolase n=1 Tax=Mucilaginibacter sp. TaxID=1882438 RepID=UPI00284C0A38|nr:nitrilase-related carbon-nitrogen hydrolase [Mucilaginibacter sp.]MDR3697312.1 nitrilase-related carbon-nitrogen hydrolase [Mucilaginibacter sp.]
MVNLSIIQFTPVWGDKPRNLYQITTLLKDLKADIIVLPELCTTGYSFLNKEEALIEGEDETGEGVMLLRKLAIEMQAMIIAGFAEKDDDKTYNSALVALPDNSFKIYRKTHLFYKEKFCFEPGNSGFFVIDHPLVDCKVGIMVCNDWRYPEAARSLALHGADLIACPSNLVSNLWGVGMPARALENKVYLAVTNRCGTEKRLLEDGSEQALTFNGGSVVYDFNGAPLVQAGKEEDAVLTVQIDPQLTRDKSFNAYNNLFADRRPGMYSLD